MVAVGDSSNISSGTKPTTSTTPSPIEPSAAVPVVPVEPVEPVVPVVPVVPVEHIEPVAPTPAPAPSIEPSAAIMTVSKTPMLATDVAKHYVKNGKKFSPLSSNEQSLVVGFASYTSKLIPFVDTTSSHTSEERKSVTSVRCTGPKNTSVLVELWNTVLPNSDNVFPLVRTSYRV